MANYDINNLSSQITSRNGYSLTPSLAESTDVFEFDISSNRILGLNLHNISSGDDADLRLFRDSNGNGILDTNDQQVASSRRSRNLNDVIRYDASAGTYFAQVERYAAGSSGNVYYDLDLSATYDVGALSGTIISRNNYSLTSSDSTDVFALTLDTSRSINLNLHDISASDDADLRLYADSNSNGIFDADDLQVASSRRSGNTDDVIDYAASAGTYFAQVERYAAGSVGNVSYDLDLSSTYDVGELGSNPISRNGYGLTETDSKDVFEFDLNNRSQVTLNLHNISSDDDADLRLYEDTNGNGIFDGDDEQVDSARRSGNLDDVITYDANAGTYFAQVERYAPGSVGNVSYDLDLSVDSSATTDVPATYQDFDTTQVFSLNSNTNADHIIYLDFDGHTTTNTPWNNSGANSSIETPAYDTDGDTSSFSTAEQETIWRIWQRVAEDFSPFNVNVTTEAPSSDRLVRSGSSDSQWGIRAVVGGDGLWFDNDRIDGVAQQNSFTSDTDIPAFIFEDNLALGNGNEISTAETISHEVGHTLGLEHDGNDLVEYYQGHGTGVTGWAPIMGYSDFRSVTQWSQGEYQNAENTEDDLAIITGDNGFGYRTDDYGDSLVSADALTVGGDQAQTYGIIETNVDVDWFSFSSATGAIDLAINAFERGANLDILARLYNSAGQLLQESNPLGSLSASFDTNLTSGDYFLSVTGTGTGNANTGYSDYGSLGQYSISGTIA